MGWSDEVHNNRKALQPKGHTPRSPALLSAIHRQPNSGTLAPIVTVTAGAFLALWWRREGRKLNGRSIKIPFLDGLQGLFSSSNSSTVSSKRNKQDNNNNWKKQQPKSMAAAAAAARSTQQNSDAAGQRGTNRQPGAGGGGGKKKKNKKKR